ncbi:hypothetical protein [Saccharopolyspora taberi]|uniref:hypothetical protein n=1 Tax=Saccharopolyspora taberi TaxID=60895 RepID=UPI0031E12D40
MERPPEWPAGGVGARFKASFVFVVVLGLACLPVGFGFAATGRSGALKYAFLLAALFLLTAQFSLIARMRPHHRISDITITSYDGHAATEVRYSGAQFALLSALVACLAALSALATWDFARADDDVPAAPVAAALTGLAAVFFVSFFVLAALGRLRRGRIVLSQQGIHQEGRTFTSFLPWESFAGAKASYNGTPEILVVAYANAHWERRQLTRVWKLDKLPPVPMIEINPTALAVDPTLLYHLVRFYLEEPSARAELGTDASLQRVRSAAFK